MPVGVEILEKTKIIERTDTSLDSTIPIAMIIAVVVSIIASILLLRFDMDELKLKIALSRFKKLRVLYIILSRIIYFIGFMITSWVISFIIINLVLDRTSKEFCGRYEYKVKISSEASFTEIITNYYYDDCQGDVYTLRDKEKED